MVETCEYCSRAVRKFVCWECYEDTRVETEEKIEALEKSIEKIQRRYRNHVINHE